MTEENATFDQLTESRRLCQLMRSEDKYVRKTALINFQNLVRYESHLSQEQYHQIFIECHTILFNTLRDRNEIVRDTSIKCVSDFLVMVLPSNDFYLAHLLPVVIERIGTEEVVEDSEEIRLLLIHFIYEIIDSYNEHHLAPNMGDFIMIVQQAVKDQFAAVKEMGCHCIIQLAKCVPQQFHMHSASLVKPVLTVLKHPHYKIRMVGIKCIVEVIMQSPYEVLTESLVPLAERMFDLNPSVRMAMVYVGARLLMSYRDRYSFFHKILPILLTGLNDEAAKVQKEAKGLWEKVGLQYEKENEKELKNQLNYLTARPKHYPVKVERPNLGCRVLIQRNIGKLVDPLCSELLCWQDGIRLRCAQLLSVVALHAEEGILQHLPQLLDAMYVAARDSNIDVLGFVIRAAEYIGTFAPVEAWVTLILPVIEGGSAKFGHFKILAALIRHANPDDILHYLNQIADVLSDKSITHVRCKTMQHVLVDCIQAIEHQYTFEVPSPCDQNLFNMLVTLISNSQDTELISDHLLEELRVTLHNPSLYHLWDRFLPKLLKTLKKNHSWGVHVFEKGIFQYILLNSRYTFGEHLDDIGAILIDCLHEDVEPESRLSTFVVLSSALEKKEVIFAYSNNTDEFFKTLIKAISPALLWQAGRTAEAMRTVAVAAVASVFTCEKDSGFFRHQPTMQLIGAKIMPLLYSLCDDTSDRTRLLTMECIQLVKYHMANLDVWSVEHLNACYPHVIRRLDDPTEKVRYMAAKLLQVILDNPPVEFLAPLYFSHHEYIIDTLFIHYDDSDETFSDIIRGALMIVGKINAKLLKEGAEKHRPVVHNQAGCDELINYLENLQINPSTSNSSIPTHENPSE